jgi:hypothetical protein
VKQNSPDILSRFANAAEVEAFLRRNSLMHWAYEGETSIAPLSTGDEWQPKSVAFNVHTGGADSVDRTDEGAFKDERSSEEQFP